MLGGDDVENGALVRNEHLMSALPYILIFASIAMFAFLLGQFFRKPGKQRDPLGVHQPDSFGPLTRPLAGVFPASQKKRATLKNELLGAGRFNSNALTNYLAKRNVCVLMVVLATALLLLSEEVDPSYNQYIIIGGFIATIFAYGIPRLILSSIATRRRQGIENAFPDALDMIAMSVEGGLPIQDAVRRVSDEFKPAHRALSQELLIISRQTDTGSVEQAMSSFAQRIDMPEIGAWAALMTQSQRLGGKMAGALLECADRMRQNRKTRAEQAGNTASIKLLLPTVLCLAPPVFILLIGPAALDFRDFINRERDGSSQLVEQANTIAGPNGRPVLQSGE